VLGIRIGRLEGITQAAVNAAGEQASPEHPQRNCLRRKCRGDVLGVQAVLASIVSGEVQHLGLRFSEDGCEPAVCSLAINFTLDSFSFLQGFASDSFGLNH
jgi:hypothetical protein